MINKKLNFEELTKLVFKENLVTKETKDRLFKLAKANGDIETIQKLAIEFDFKSAKIYLSNKKNLSLEDALKKRDFEQFKKIVDEGMDTSKVKVTDLIEKKYDDKFIKFFIEKKYFVNLAQLVKQNYEQDIIKKALDNGGKVDDVYKDYVYGDLTGLAYASMFGKTNIVKLLLEYNPNINKKFIQGATALYYALVKGHNEIIRLLLENGADIESRISNGFTCLMQAASDNNIEAVKLLLEYDADINAQSANKGTPLLLAVIKNNYEIAKLLLEKGANPNIKEILQDATALDLATNQEMIELLKQYNASSNSSRMPELIQAFLDYDFEQAKHLLSQGHNINQEFDNTNALIHSSRLGDVDLVNILLDYGADINYTTKAGFTPLTIATYQNEVDVVNVLLHRGANKNIKGYNGLTAYEIATNFKPNKTIIDLLNSFGENATAFDKKSKMEKIFENDYKELVLHKTIELQDKDRVKEFFDNLTSPQKLEREIGKIKKDSTPLILKKLRRTTLSNEEMLKDIIVLSVGDYDGAYIHNNLNGIIFTSIKTNIGYFLDFPCYCTVADPWTNSKLPTGIDWSNNIGQIYNNDFPLIFATYAGHIFLHKIDELTVRNLYRYENDTFSIVKEAKAFDYENTDLYEQLFTLVRDKYDDKTEIKLRQLLEKNLDINKTTIDSKTALVLAIENQNVPTVELLLKNGAEVNIQNKEGFSPLMLATILNNFEICNLLVANKADINIKNYRGQDCALLAARNMNPDIIILFEDLGLDIQNPKPYNVEEFEEKNAIELANKIEDALVDRKLISEFMIYALDYNYEYELDIDDYVKRDIGYRITFRVGRNSNFSKKVIDIYTHLHKYLGDINVSDESKINIRIKIFDILMNKFQLGKYEYSRFDDVIDTNQDVFIRKLKIIDSDIQGEVDVFNSCIITKFLTKDGEINSTQYIKKSENKYNNEAKGEIVISKSTIIEKNNNGAQRISRFVELSHSISNINKIHDPKALSNLLKNFSKPKLKYTNHDWDDSTLTYEKFMKEVIEGWDEIKENLKILLSEYTHKNIEDFLFNDKLGEVDSQDKIISWGDGITVGWSSSVIALASNKPHLYKNFKEIMDSFKSLFVIKQDNKDLKLLKKFTKLRKENKYKFNLDLEQIKEVSIENIFTDVHKLELALSTILSEINDRVDEGKSEVKVTLDQNEQKTMVTLKIIHTGSISKSDAETLEKAIEKDGGFKGIYKNLSSVCDWSIETICPDGKRYKVDYLYPEIDSNKPHSYQIDEQMEGFTHILRFYI